MFSVLRCTNLDCGRFSYCKSSQKTKKCPYCHKRIKVSKATEIEVDTNEQARLVVQAYNESLGEVTEPSWMSNAAPKNSEYTKN